ncbi:hypothetical protein QZH41_019002, partial [Actinostola sp. cb2023]
ISTNARLVSISVMLKQYVPTTDGSYTCKCKLGYHGDGRTCTDINECSSGAHKCHAKAYCTNTDGSYICRCIFGYHGDGRTCTDTKDADRLTADYPPLSPQDLQHTQMSSCIALDDLEHSKNLGFFGFPTLAEDIAVLQNIRGVS